MLTQRDLLRLIQFVCGYTGVFYLVDDLERQLLRSFALLRIKCGIDAKKAGIAWCVGKRRYAKREPGLFTHALVEPRTAAVAQNRGEQIQRGNVRARYLRYVPCHREMSQLGRKFLVHFAAAKLRRFARNE